MSKYLDATGLARVWGKVKGLVGTLIPLSQKGAAGGVATLGSDGRLPSAQLPSLKSVNGISLVGSGNIGIDVSLFKIVDSLPVSSPNSGIDATKIYLVEDGTSAESNIYTEYIYEDGEWKTVGVYKSDIDLTRYLKKESAGIMATQGEDAGGGMTLQITDNGVGIGTNVSLPCAKPGEKIDGGADGLMSGEDKLKLDSLNYLVSLGITDHTEESIDIIGIDNDGSEGGPSIPSATTTLAGLMSAKHAKLMEGIFGLRKIFTGLGSVAPTDDTVECEIRGLTPADEWYWEEESLDTLVIPAATPDTAGVMSAADKEKLDNGVLSWDNTSFDDSVYEDYYQIILKDTSVNGEISHNIPAAKQDSAGVMSAADKKKLDGVPFQAMVSLSETDYEGLVAAGTIDANTLYLVTEEE